MRNFFTVINCNWELNVILLHAVEIRGDHSGVNISHFLLKTINDYELKNKIFFITADNVRIMIVIRGELASL